METIKFWVVAIGCLITSAGAAMMWRPAGVLLLGILIIALGFLLRDGDR